MTEGFLWPVRVYYEDTDSGGVVYYANYLRFMERARTEWLRHLGYEQDVLARQEGVVFVVRRVELDYRSPARFNEALEVTVELIAKRAASLGFRQEVRRPSDAQVCCRGRVEIACVGAATLRPSRIPARLLAEIGDVL
jgi:acyl-CoA thioester hydrolase